MVLYNVTAQSVTVGSGSAVLLKISFGDPAGNDSIVPAAVQAVKSLDLVGGSLVLLNGPASLPVAVALAHAICHIYAAVGVFDPKLSGYVVAVSHDPGCPVGSVIPAFEVAPA